MKYFSLLMASLSALFSFADIANGANSDTLKALIQGNKIQYVNSINMEVSPQQLLVHGNFLYVKSNKKIFQLSLENLEAPKILKEYTVEFNQTRFGKMFAHGERLYVPTSNGEIYEFDQHLQHQNILSLHDNKFEASVIYIDAQNTIWVGGKMNKKAYLASYTITQASVCKASQLWLDTLSREESNVEAILEKGSRLLISMRNGQVISFDKMDLNKNNYLQNNAASIALGYSMIINGNHAFWANCAAGLTTIDIANPAKPEVKCILSNSQFKKQHPHAKGTNVCDIVYNKKKNYICVANGWQGIFVADAADPNKVIDYIPSPEFNNHCIATQDSYLYVGNISAGKNGDLKGVKVFKLN